MDLDILVHGAAALTSAIAGTLIMSRGAGRRDRLLFTAFLASAGMRALVHFIILLGGHSELGTVLSVLLNTLLLASGAFALLASVDLRRGLGELDVLLVFPSLMVVLYSLVLPPGDDPLSRSGLFTTLPFLVASYGCYLGMMCAAIVNLWWVGDQIGPRPLQRRLSLLIGGLTAMTAFELLSVIGTVTAENAPALAPAGTIICSLLVIRSFTARSGARM